jgi:oxygen-independent coproporphyrinogen-3 oxidase
VIRAALVHVSARSDPTLRHSPCRLVSHDRQILTCDVWAHPRPGRNVLVWVSVSASISVASLSVPGFRLSSSELMTQTTNPRSGFLPKYALEAVPRYTSYPPATKFHDGIGDTDWSEWMLDLPQAAALSIYVHIPFCRAMCWYCGCNTTIPNKDSRVSLYLEALHLEIENRARTVPSDGVVRHIHFGGGSPDMLSADRFSKIMDTLRNTFTIADDAEIAVELDPRGLSLELARSMAQCGVTRASLGVQDLSEEVQQLIHRIQPEKAVRQAVEHLRTVGINAINMDIMYGLPAQTVERVERTAQAVADLRPDRLAVFGYAHVPWFKKHQRAIPEDRLPDAQARFEQMLAAAAILQDNGYDTVGFDHFARPGDSLALAARDGTLRRNFQGYTNDNYDALIGLGASSISDTHRGFAQNIVDPSRYADAVLDQQSVIARGVERSPAELAIGSVVDTLMCQFEISRDQMNLLDVADVDVDELQRDGLIVMDDDVLRVTTRGRLYVRNIAARLDPGFQAAHQKHSLAV